MQTRKYEIMLAAIIAARATSFIFSKIALGTMSAFNLLAIRFILAFVLLAIIFRRRLIRITLGDLASGALCGAIFFCVMTCEYSALKTSDSSMVSLLENCSIIFVPLFEAIFLRKLPGKLTVISALTAVLGVFCITAQNNSFSGGILFGLLSAAFYAVAIITTGVVSRKAKDTLCIGIVQIGALGLLALAATFLFETPHFLQQPSQWFTILALSLVCTCFGYTLQPVAQQYVSADRAGLFCAISPAIAVILGAVVLHEHLGALSILGLFLILFSIVLPYMRVCQIKVVQKE